MFEKEDERNMFKERRRIELIGNDDAEARDNETVRGISPHKRGQLWLSSWDFQLGRRDWGADRVENKLQGSNRPWQ